jgi:hypothetical protein
VKKSQGETSKIQETIADAKSIKKKDICFEIGDF